MPSTKKNAKWVVESITPTSSADHNSIIIKNREKNYCNDCYFLIGVVSDDKGAEYSFALEKFDATFKNSLFLKVGEK